jgi:hypothetical protein
MKTKKKRPGKRSRGRRSGKRRSSTKAVGVKKMSLWSHDVHAKWHPPAGLFSKGSAKHIASTLKRGTDRRTAMSRLNFYMNRAGSNLSREQRAKLEHAKDMLRA